MQCAGYSTNVIFPLIPLYVSQKSFLLLFLLLLLLLLLLLPLFFSFSFILFEMEFRSCYPGWSAMAQSWLTATSAFWVQANLLPQPPE